MDRVVQCLLFTVIEMMSSAIGRDRSSCIFALNFLTTRLGEVHAPGYHGDGWLIWDAKTGARPARKLNPHYPVGHDDATVPGRLEC